MSYTFFDYVVLRAEEGKVKRKRRKERKKEREKKMSAVNVKYNSIGDLVRFAELVLCAYKSIIAGAYSLYYFVILSENWVILLSLA